jgi:hypothetical protein
MIKNLLPPVSTGRRNKKKTNETQETDGRKLEPKKIRI